MAGLKSCCCAGCAWGEGFFPWRMMMITQRSKIVKNQRTTIKVKEGQTQTEKDHISLFFE
jgi:hypothetical protein